MINMGKYDEPESLYSGKECFAQISIGLRDYLKEFSVKAAAKYTASAVLCCITGFSAKGWERHKDEYSAGSVRVISRSIGNDFSECMDIKFMQANDKSVYIPRTDGKGNITGLCKVEKIVTDVGSGKTSIKGLELKLVENGDIAIDAKGLH